MRTRKIELEEALSQWVASIRTLLLGSFLCVALPSQSSIKNQVMGARIAATWQHDSA